MPSLRAFVNYPLYAACIVCALLIGSASALFLQSLDWLGALRDSNLFVLLFLPFAGVFISYAYQKLGAGKELNNALIRETYLAPKKYISPLLTPLVYLATLASHFFGGSVGREGTAVQMGASISDTISKYLNFNSETRQILLLCGVSAGFSGVFGTPFTALIFAFEFLVLGKINSKALIPCVLASFVAHYTCLAWQVSHTAYPSVGSIQFSFSSLAYTLLVGCIAGLAAFCFMQAQRVFHLLYSGFKNPYYKPFLGGLTLVSVVYLSGAYPYIGLGVPQIVAAFTQPAPYYAFALKLLLTTFTLAVGFKGGEVTPLFFIGATLGSALSLIIPLPIAFLAALGFVAVFAGATKAPLACSVMGVELFGWQGAVYFGLVCGLAYFTSGKSSIYGPGRPHILYCVWQNHQRGNTIA